MKRHRFASLSLVVGALFLSASARTTDLLPPPASVSPARFDATIPTLRQGTGIELSSFGRDLLKYIARCALPSSAHIQITHDDVTDTVDGGFALASDWQTAPLSEAGKRWVSACLLAHVNAFGEHVLVSFRASHPGMAQTMTDEERATFTSQEGAFYGNLFSIPPVAYVCRGEGTSQSPSRQKRVCTEAATPPPLPLSRCDMILTGACKDVCTVDGSKDHYVAHCKGGSQIFDEVVTTFLPAK